MRVSKAAEKFKISPGRIHYLRRTGLLSPSRGTLQFADLVRLQFIADCRRQKVSLQRIRSFLERTGDAPNSPIGNARMISPTVLVVADDGRLVQPDTGQLYFDYASASDATAAPGHRGGSLVELKDRARVRQQDERMNELEHEFSDAMAADGGADIERVLEEILDLEPDHVGALIEFGNIAFENEDLDRALEYYDRAVSIDGTCVEALYNLANIYFRKGKFAPAIRYYQASLDLDPDFAESYYNLGLVYYSLNYLDRARGLFEIYAGLDPDSEWRSQAETFLNEIDARLSASDQSPDLFDKI